MSLGRKTMGTSQASYWAGMQMFMENQVAPDDPRKEVIYRNFQRNLTDILNTGLKSGAKVILNTVASNLRDCPPFASLAAERLNAGDRTALDQLRESGAAAESEGKFAAAAQYYQNAARLDPTSADLEFRQGIDFLRRLYADGAFHPDSAGMTFAQCQGAFLASKIGIHSEGLGNFYSHWCELTT